MFGGATEVPVDQNGRILIPDFLKSRAGLKTKAAIIGVKNRAEIWDEATWETYKKNVEREADGLAEKLGSVGVL
jgi:MraZ protein